MPLLQLVLRFHHGLQHAGIHAVDGWCACGYAGFLFGPCVLCCCCYEADCQAVHGIAVDWPLILLLAEGAHKRQPTEWQGHTTQGAEAAPAKGGELTSCSLHAPERGGRGGAVSMMAVVGVMCHKASWGCNLLLCGKVHDCLDTNY